MRHDQVSKKRVLKEIEKLPEDKLQEVLDFIGYLLNRERSAQVIEPMEDLDPAKDPLLRFIGGVSHGSLAKDIDKELYGDLD